MKPHTTHKSKPAAPHDRAAMKELACLVAHDLKSPLNIIGNYAELITATKNPEKRLAAVDLFLPKILGKTVHMRKLIDGLLAFTLLDHTEPVFKTVEMQDVMQEALKKCAIEIEVKNATVNVGPLPSLLGNAPQLQQMMHHLLKNALTFTEGKAPHIRILATDKQSDWMISIADNGIGIPAEYLTHVLQPLKRLHTQSVYPGTGLGLAICDKIAAQHQGALWVESVEGNGSVVSVSLPKTPSSA